MKAVTAPIRAVLVVVSAAGLLSSVDTRAQTQSPPPPLPLRLTAWAVSMGTVATGANQVVDINITRWSTAEEREMLIKTFFEKGQDKLVDALQETKPVGRLRYPNVQGPDPHNMRLGYDLHYAWHTPLPEGGTRILVAFDRYIGFREAREQPRTIDYPFTLIEIRLPKEGKGEGKMAVATKISFDKKKNTVELENYSSEPVRLQEVRIQK